MFLDVNLSKCNLHFNLLSQIKIELFLFLLIPNMQTNILPIINITTYSSYRHNIHWWVENEIFRNVITGSAENAQVCLKILCGKFGVSRSKIH